MNSCAYYQELISTLVDGEISREENEALMLHLNSCSRCNAMYAVFHDLSDILSEEPQPLPEGLHENIMAGVRRSEIMKRNRRMRKVGMRTALTAAACAVLVLFAAAGFDPGRRADSVSIRSEEAASELLASPSPAADIFADAQTPTPAQTPNSAPAQAPAVYSDAGSTATYTYVEPEQSNMSSYDPYEASSPVWTSTPVYTPAPPVWTPDPAQTMTAVWTPAPTWDAVPEQPAPAAFEPDAPTLAQSNDVAVPEPDAPSIAQPNAAAVPEPDAPSLAQSNDVAVPEPDAPSLAQPNAAVVPEPDAPSLAQSNAAVVPEPDAPTIAQSNAAVVPEPDAPTIAQSNAVAVPEPDAPSLAQSNAVVFTQGASDSEEPVIFTAESDESFLRSAALDEQQAEDTVPEENVPAENEDEGETIPFSLFSDIASLFDTASDAQPGESKLTAPTTIDSSLDALMAGLEEDLSPVPNGIPLDIAAEAGKAADEEYVSVYGSQSRAQLLAMIGSSEDTLPQEAELTRLVHVTLLPDDAYGSEEKMDIAIYGDFVYCSLYPVEGGSVTYRADCSLRDLDSFLLSCAAAPVPSASPSPDPFAAEPPAPVPTADETGTESGNE